MKKFIALFIAFLLVGCASGATKVAQTDPSYPNGIRPGPASKPLPVSEVLKIKKICKQLKDIDDKKTRYWDGYDSCVSKDIERAQNKQDLKANAKWRRDRNWHNGKYVGRVYLPKSSVPYAKKPTPQLEPRMRYEQTRSFNCASSSVGGYGRFSTIETSCR